MASTSQNLRKRTPASNTDEATQPMINKPQQAAAHQQPLLLSIDFQPEWYKDNEYIHTGYRPVTNSYLGSLRSFLYIHNETGNIYSHLLAALWMLLLPLIYYPYAKEHYSTANSDDWLVFGLFFLGGFLCYTCSVAYHVFSNHSHAVHDVCLRVDLFGITTVTAGCFPPGMWYTFPCMDRKTRIWWISIETLAQILAAIAIFLVPAFRARSMKPLRGFVFSFMASAAFYPIIAACFLHGYRIMDREAGATRYALTVLTYLLAVTIYATKLPEASRPGAFDIWGHSHQIFHVLMAVGLTIHFAAFAKAFDYIHTRKQC
ncbi:MAG: hypothetical protein HETSPECPRED_002796 [Heterodermia speciosa]|uniref:Uncharacterized protein n=1 Tax=Heterodermia speciosa TaxID=116794 RepID=A0A8H3F0Z4_9LECA|nr:MAG: hypothetical protein HETSPECPRED_002796 [Heterodermia speciosa]